MADEKRILHNQTSGSQSGQSNPTHGADKDSGKQGEQGRENQPEQPKKEVHSEEGQKEHQKTGSR